ncbi:hypothetical protein EVAR_76042_1 [Eumeta japonica]|uniref:Uncharacterized protein n=1 Tax=Eumeta variegata TaxID=151549 RepID=A0A4C1UBK6_EUMVA|nr:hypothetical protein EVAR_76042_1 [Eumeta japonica]
MTRGIDALGPMDKQKRNRSGPYTRRRTLIYQIGSRIIRLALGVQGPCYFILGNDLLEGPQGYGLSYEVEPYWVRISPLSTSGCPPNEIKVCGA